MKNILIYSQSTIDSLFSIVDKRICELDEIVRNLERVIREQAVVINGIPDVVINAIDEKLQTIESNRLDRLNGANPYFEVISEIDVSNDGKTKFELDWNPAFIKELKSKGYTGNTEADFVHKWLRTIADNVEKGLPE